MIHSEKSFAVTTVPFSLFDCLFLLPFAVFIGYFSRTKLKCTSFQFNVIQCILSRIRVVQYTLIAAHEFPYIYEFICTITSKYISINYYSILLIYDTFHRNYMAIGTHTSARSDTVCVCVCVCMCVYDGTYCGGHWLNACLKLNGKWMFIKWQWVFNNKVMCTFNIKCNSIRMIHFI